MSQNKKSLSEAARLGLLGPMIIVGVVGAIHHAMALAWDLISAGPANWAWNGSGLILFGLLAVLSAVSLFRRLRNRTCPFQVGDYLDWERGKKAEYADPLKEGWRIEDIHERTDGLYDLVLLHIKHRESTRITVDFRSRVRASVRASSRASGFSGRTTPRRPSWSFVDRNDPE